MNEWAWIVGRYFDVKPKQETSLIHNNHQIKVEKEEIESRKMNDDEDDKDDKEENENENE